MKFFATLIICLGLTSAVLAQTIILDDQKDQTFEHLQKAGTGDPGPFKKRWIIGVGINAVNDSRYNPARGNTDFKNYFDPKVWDYNLITVPVDYALNDNFYLNAMISNNSNKDHERKIFAADFNLKYSFVNLFPDDYWFEPYVLGGTGYTWRDISKNNRFNFNFGVGTYFWLNDSWGINLQAAGKLTVKKDLYNYKQNTLALVYRL